MPEGWVFIMPGVWPVGSRWSCLVNDAQKAQLLASLRRSRFVSFVLYVLLSGLGVFGGLALALSHHGPLLAIIFYASFVLAVVLLLGVGGPLIELRFVLRPVLAGAVPTARPATSVSRASKDMLWVTAIAAFPGALASLVSYVVARLGLTGIEPIYRQIAANLIVIPVLVFVSAMAFTLGSTFADVVAT
jgi:hypothetical protein